MPTPTYLPNSISWTSPEASASINGNPAISATLKITPLERLSVIANNCPSVPSKTSADPELLAL